MSRILYESALQIEVRLICVSRSDWQRLDVCGVFTIITQKYICDVHGHTLRNLETYDIDVGKIECLPIFLLQVLQVNDPLIILQLFGVQRIRTRSALCIVFIVEKQDR